MGNNLYSNLVNFYNVNDENFKEFMSKIYKEMLLTHRDVQYVKEHLTEEIVKILDKYLVDGKFNVNIKEKVEEFLENNQEIKNINTKLNTNINNIENITSQLGANTNNIENITSQLDTIEKKLLNPEMFRIQNGIEVDDQTAFNKALEVALLTTKELHYYQDYELNNIIISSTLTLVGHNTKLITKNNVDVFIEVNNNARVYFKDLYVKCDKAKIGILNNDGVLDIDNTYVRGAIEKNVEYRKVGTHGDGQIDKLFTQMSPIGLHLNATDVKVKRLYGFNCLIHVKNSGSGCFLSDCHGWNLKDSSYGDWVTGSTYLVTGKGSIILSDIYADTVETAIELPTTNSTYTLINITNLTYFLNRTYYPNGVANPPKIFKNVSGFLGKICVNGLQCDNSAWMDNSGNLAPLFESKPSPLNFMINGVTNIGFSDGYAINYQQGDLANYIATENRTYYSPYLRKYIRDKGQINIFIKATMNKYIPDNTCVYSIKLNEPFNVIDYNIIASAFCISDTTKELYVCKEVDGTISVYNKNGYQINNGSLILTLQFIDFN